LGFVKDMSKRRQSGATVSTCVDNLGKYLLSAIQSLEGMVDAGGFRSKTITQMKEIVETMDFVKVCSTGGDSIHQRMKAKAAFISSTRGYDTIYRAWYAFTDTFREVNSSLNLNAINLMCGVEVLISMLLFKFGGLNDTWYDTPVHNPALPHTLTTEGAQDLLFRDLVDHGRERPFSDEGPEGACDRQAKAQHHGRGLHAGEDGNLLLHPIRLAGYP